MNHITRDASVRLTRSTRASSLPSGRGYVLVLASTLLLPAALFAQAGGGGGGAGAGGASAGSSAGGTSSGSIRREGPEAAQPSAPSPTESPAQREAVDEGPTGMPEGWWENWTDTKKRLRHDIGLELSLNGDVVWRSTVTGPDDNIDRVIARYDIGLKEHFTEDSLLSLQVRGGWGKGLDPYLGTFANTDQYAGTPEQIFILHLFYQHELFDDQLTLRVGKFDIGDWLDTNRYGYYNFLAYVMAHNTTIPLTGNTLGAMATWAPKEAEWFYISGGASNSQQTPTETGLDYVFDDDTSWLSMAEVGFKPKFFGREGVYRFTGWYNNKEFISSAGDTETNASGISVSFDQDLTDRLGVFFRFGTPFGTPFEPKRYYSAGFNIKEPIPGRTKDSLTLGFALNEFTDARGDVVADAEDTETYIELYYNWQLFPWLQIQPVIQVVDNPGGLDESTVVIGGVHLAFRF